ncbi:MAG: hypothetical protein J6X84_02245 [Treponema sp.]|nr:hypothetical protein [Treponema sp.]
MKLIYKKTFCALVSTAAFALLFAQNNQNNNQNIELPEVTTVISAESDKVQSDALPDFSDVLLSDSGSGEINPVLPEVESSDNTELAQSHSAGAEKSVYAEGLLGGGYPTLFMGNISVFRNVGENPFRFSLSHDSAIGYAGHALTDNYSDRTTKIEIARSYKKNHFTWSAGGFYQTAANGLQGNLISDGKEISQLNRDSYNANGKIGYEFSNGFFIDFAANFDFYNRFSDVSCRAIPTFSYLDIEPALKVGWKGHGFETGISAEYSYGYGKETSYLPFENGHRAQFTANLSWKNDFVHFYGNAAAVIGNQIDEKPVIVPFTIGFESLFPVYFANRRVAISAEGGIKSYKPQLYELEEKFKFAQINQNPSETSDWYGKFGLKIPLKTAFTGSANLEYYKTAYDNGVWEADYSEDLSGLYFIYKNEHELLITDFSLSYSYEFFTITGGWRSNWKDIPVLENRQAIHLAINLQDEEVRWGIMLDYNMAINNTLETPVLNLETFIRLTKSVRLVISVNDLIKLYKAENRIYAGNYAARGGSATMLLKFFF